MPNLVQISRFERSFFSLFCLFVFVVCLVLFSLVAAALLANKDVYIIVTEIDTHMRQTIIR